MCYKPLLLAVMDIESRAVPDAGSLPEFTHRFSPYKHVQIIYIAPPVLISLLAIQAYTANNKTLFGHARLHIINSYSYALLPASITTLILQSIYHQHRFIFHSKFTATVKLPKVMY